MDLFDSNRVAELDRACDFVARHLENSAVLVLVGQAIAAARIGSTEHDDPTVLHRGKLIRRHRDRVLGTEPLDGPTLPTVAFPTGTGRSPFNRFQTANVPNGLVVSLPRSKTNQTGDQAELAVVPSAIRTSRCPVAAVHHWLELAAITTGPVLRRVTKGNRLRSVASPFPLD